MALQKTISMPSGVSGNYIRLTSHHWSRASRESSAIFSLYLNAATAATSPPLVPVIAKLRLTGTAFDAWLSPAVLASADGDILAQLYAAAKVGPVISDHGSSVFADADDV